MKNKGGDSKTFIGFTILVILIVGVLYLISQNINQPPSVSDTTNSGDTSGVPSEGQDVDKILIGVSTPLEPSDLAYVYDETSGDLQKVSEPTGWRAADIKKYEQATFEAAANDPIATRFHLGTLWDVVLRDAKGRSYQDPVFLGRLDETTAVIQAQKDQSYILFVGTSGSITEAYILPELYKVHGIFDHAVWVTTAVPGEGIESAPQGPAHVIHIDSEGNTSLTLEDMVIEQLTAFNATSYAYRFTNGSYKAHRGNYLWEGTGTPLFWLDENTLLVSQGHALKRVNLVDSSQETIGEMDGTASMADRVHFSSP